MNHPMMYQMVVLDHDCSQMIVLLLTMVKTGVKLKHSMQLPTGVADQLSDATEPIKVKLGPNAVMWSGNNRMR